jgi:hypothetical protein
LNDLQGGTLTLDAEMLSAEEGWESIYKDMNAFKLVPFSQFKQQLKAHQGQVHKLVSKSTAQYSTFCQDQAMQQRHTNYQDGCLIFAAFPAGKLLKADVCAQQQTRINIGQLQQSRAEYSQWNRAEFTCCLYQEVQYGKFVNCMEQKHKALISQPTKETDCLSKKRKAGI